MPSLSEIATVTRRGGNIPDIESELAYSGYCLYEAVKAEMQRSGSFEVVKRGDIEGMEGKVSVPTVLKFLWPELFKDRHDAAADQIRKALYQYLRDTRNLICITPGHMREMSTWWARHDWSDQPAEAAKPSPQPAVEAAPEKPVPQHTAAEAKDAIKRVHDAAPPAPEPNRPEVPRTVFRAPASEPCHYCGRTFITQAHLTKHVYKEHENLTDLILAALTTFTLPAYLTDLVKKLQSEFSYPGSGEAIRTRLVAMTSIDDGVVNLKEEEGDRRLYSVSSLITMDAYERTAAAVTDAGLGSSTYACREPSCSQAFFDATTRARHEDSAHPDSPWRAWRCQLCSASRIERSFYSQLAWAMHLSGSHKLGSLDNDYQVLRRDASALARDAISKLTSSAEPPAQEPQAEPEPAPEPEPEPALTPEPAAAPPATAEPASRSSDLVIGDAERGLALHRDLVEAYRHLLLENEALRNRLGAHERRGSIPVPASAASTDGYDAMKKENEDLRRQVATLQRLMANLT